MQTNETEWFIVGRRGNTRLYGDRILGRYSTTSLRRHALIFKSKEKAVRLLHRELDKYHFYSLYTWAVRRKVDVDDE